MILSATLCRYLARHYLLNLLLILAVLLAVVYLFDTVELLRRASKKDGIPFSLVLQMGLLKLPEVGQLLVPFAVLFSAMFTFWQLTRRYELIAARAAGLSVWQFLAPVMMVALMAGFLNIAAINPVGAMLLGKFETLENEYLSNKKNYVTLLREGLWLRQNQPAAEGTSPAQDGYLILHAAQINLAHWELQDVMVLFFSENNDFTRRIDAEKARLDQGMWVLENAHIHDAVQKSKSVDEATRTVPVVTLPTVLTAKDLEESFSSPETLSFWALPSFIKTLEMTGFDATAMRIHYYSLLAQPLLFVAMILLAASVSLRPPRFSGTMMLIVIGVFAGFIVFFAASFLQALGASHRLPAFLAAWTPALVTFFLGGAAILHLEDG